ncbi:hypothetical protein JW898_00090 [Candidatus Woesearchaeota archaeon]|nr:hypothetical protein [Candidatus Woesearchaeota archaeon]
MSRIRKHRLKKALIRQEQPKKKMSKQMLMTMIIGGLMVLSVFGIMFSSYNSGNEKVTYGDHIFKQTSKGWTTEIGGRKAEFSYLPGDIEGLEISKEITDRLKSSKVVYITFNPNTKSVQNFELMRFELGNAMSQLGGVYAMAGVSEENEKYTQPLVDCRNATATLPVISITEGNETRAYLDGECIVLESDEYASGVLKDRVLYAMLGIIE